MITKKGLIVIFVFFVSNIIAMENEKNTNEKIHDKLVEKIKSKKKKPKYIIINNKTPNEIEIATRSRKNNITDTIASRKNYKLRLLYKTEEIVFECPTHRSFTFAKLGFDNKSVNVELHYNLDEDTYCLIPYVSNSK